MMQQLQPGTQFWSSEMSQQVLPLHRMGLCALSSFLRTEKDEGEGREGRGEWDCESVPSTGHWTVSRALAPTQCLTSNTNKFLRLQCVVILSSTIHTDHIASQLQSSPSLCWGAGRDEGEDLLCQWIISESSNRLEHYSVPVSQCPSSEEGRVTLIEKHSAAQYHDTSEGEHITSHHITSHHHLQHQV